MQIDLHGPVQRLDGALNDLGKVEMVISVIARQHQISCCLPLSLFYSKLYKGNFLQ